MTESLNTSAPSVQLTLTHSWRDSASPVVVGPLSDASGTRLLIAHRGDDARAMAAPVPTVEILIAARFSRVSAVCCICSHAPASRPARGDSAAGLQHHDDHRGSRP
ncbi:hypothetical protein [Rhodococcus jostii]|uniref:hypothetical protein n=1 Tax=Rhodococcus jostii TaxID=132919 RepID=UPI000A723FB1|nr:hypothetical protein [Rhodococcus jostii]